MARLKGISVTLVTRRAVLDDFNHPSWEEHREAVENVLVGEPVQAERVSGADVKKARAAYTLAIPKGDTHDWEDAEVEFWGKRWRQYGRVIQGIESMIPLDWNKKITVEEVI